MGEERQLWQTDGVECKMVSCCSGAELELGRDGTIVLRELYPANRTFTNARRLLKGEVAGTRDTRDDRSDSPA